LRSATVCVALVALVLRALVPVGWMSSTAAASPSTLVPCPMMDGMRGMLTPTSQPQHPAKHQMPLSHEGSICPFATPSQPVRALEPHRIDVAPAGFTSFGRALSPVAAEWDHASRAPPQTA
jgi:hypothetical protein